MESSSGFAGAPLEGLLKEEHHQTEPASDAPTPDAPKVLSPPIDPTSSPQLAVEWRLYKKGGLSLEFDSEVNLAARFDHMKDQGVTGAEILAEIRRARTKERPNIEPIWEFQNRLLQKGGRPEQFQGIKEWLEEEQQNAAN
jgi:hypothetical protein